MIFESAFYGKTPIDRIYLGGRIIWEANRVYAFGEVLARLLTLADPEAEAVTPVLMRVDAQSELVGTPETQSANENLLALSEGLSTDARPQTQEPENVRLELAAGLLASAAPSTYGVVFSRGVMESVFAGTGMPRAAETVPGAGTMAASLTGFAVPTVEPLLRTLAAAQGNMLGSAMPEAQEPDSVLMSTGAQLAMSACPETKRVGLKLLHDWNFKNLSTTNSDNFTWTRPKVIIKDSVSNAEAVFTNPTGVYLYGSKAGGLRFEAPSHYVDLGAIFAYDRTYEIDVYSMVANTSAAANRRFLMFGNSPETTAGICYRHATSSWAFYCEGWSESYDLSSDRNAVSGHTVTVKIDKEGYVEMLLDGVSYGKSTVKATKSFTNVYIGSGTTANANAYGANLSITKISGFRVYEGT